MILMFRNIILAGVVLVLVGCGKPAGLRAINVNGGAGRQVIVVQDYKWRITNDGLICGATKMSQDNSDQWHYENYVEPADQKAYDTVYEYLKGRKPLKAD